MIRIFTLLLVSGSAAPLHAQVNATDLPVSDRTLVQRCVMKEFSPRSIAVGVPGGFNYAFDAQSCTPLAVWYGDFLNLSGEVNGRGGRGAKPLGLTQPIGADRFPLRIGEADPVPKSLRFQGYRRSASSGDPTFLFEIDGVSVEQTLHSPKPNRVVTELRFPTPGDQVRFYRMDPGVPLQIRLGEGLRWSGPGVIEIPAGLTSARITLDLKPTKGTFVRTEEKLTGEEVFKNFCSACHSTDGTKLIGPTFRGFWGGEQTITRNGATETVTIDRDYVRESILKPQAAIVKGYEAVPMADFSSALTGDQIESLIDYISQLD